MQQSFALPNQSVPLSRIQLHFSCSKLINMDLTSKSDPQIYVFLQDIRSSNWSQLGKTEMISDNLNPKFSTAIEVNYFFEETQNMRFVVVDVDKPNGKMQDQDLLGEIQLTLGSIVGSKGSQVTKELSNPNTHKKAGYITITAEEVQELRMVANFRLSAKHLDKKDFFGKSDPFMVISKARENGDWIKIHETEPIMKTLDPVWRPFSLPIQKINNGDMERTLLFECYDWNKSGNSDFIGKFEASVRQLMEKKQFPLFNPKKGGKKGYTDSGILIIDQCELIKEPSFLDYIFGGCQINLMVAVDFTASNGNPKMTNSLHYRTPYEPNEYEKAILSVGEILSYYDSDRLFPAFGFGAKIPPNHQVSHCFPLNGNPNDPQVFGVDGIRQAYHQTLDVVELYGPTNFSSIINVAARYASQHCSQTSQQYMILLIITDGEITDMDATIEEIVNASSLPLSIIIVGVGSADFSKMEILDADDKALRASNGKVAERDIVQFVPFREYKTAYPGKLAADTLAEIPGQLLSFMKKKGIKPNPPPQPVYVPQPSFINAETSTASTAPPQ